MLGDASKTDRQLVPAMERHYSVGEIAKLWSLSEKTVRKMFDGEGGVLSFGSVETRKKRSYVTLRIPESVMIRVHQRMRVSA
jgi:hypothetical protein